MYNKYMQMAIEEALMPTTDVPVGAVIVFDGRVIAKKHNMREENNLATAHAEILAINEACKVLNSWRLSDCDLYVTLEPCPMCAGAIINARIRRLYFGAYDLKAGACGSKIDLFKDNFFNHTPEIYDGIMEETCSFILKKFFSEIREKG